MSVTKLLLTLENMDDPTNACSSWKAFCTWFSILIGGVDRNVLGSATDGFINVAKWPETFGMFLAHEYAVGGHPFQVRSHIALLKLPRRRGRNLDSFPGVSPDGEVICLAYSLDGSEVIAPNAETFV